MVKEKFSLEQAHEFFNKMRHVNLWMVPLPADHDSANDKPRVNLSPQNVTFFDNQSDAELFGNGIAIPVAAFRIIDVKGSILRKRIPRTLTLSELLREAWVQLNLDQYERGLRRPAQAKNNNQAFTPPYADDSRSDEISQLVDPKSSFDEKISLAASTLGGFEPAFQIVTGICTTD